MCSSDLQPLPHPYLFVQIISYNLRNDITAYAKEILHEVNAASISYDELANKLERLKDTFNAVAKRRGRL